MLNVFCIFLVLYGFFGMQLHPKSESCAFRDRALGRCLGLGAVADLLVAGGLGLKAGPFSAFWPPWCKQFSPTQTFPSCPSSPEWQLWIKTMSQNKPPSCGSWILCNRK